jgi:hypothetical protein
MKRINRLVFALFFIASTFFFSGCNSVVKTFSARAGADYKVNVLPPPGLIYSHVKAPLTTVFNNTPNEANMKMAHKKTSYFSIPTVSINFAWGNAAIQRIAQEAGIEQVTYADYEFWNIFTVFKAFRVNVYGYGPEQKNKYK